MKCDEFRSFMARAAAKSLLPEDVTRAERSAIRAHRRDCPACDAWFVEQVRLEAKREGPMSPDEYEAERRKASARATRDRADPEA